MSDEEFDPCECTWNNLVTQQLLSILRQSQDYCSDIECFRVPESREPTRVCSDFLFTCVIIGVAVFMYAFRPTLNFRQSSEDIIKNNNEPGPQNGPPSPPTAN